AYEKKSGFPPFCGTSIDYLFTNEATCANFVFWGKTSPPFLACCCLEGFCSSLYLFRVGRMMGAEGSDGKTSPPFWHPSFDSSEVIFGSYLLKGLSPLAFVLHLLCLLCRRFFGSDLLKGRSPLAFILHLLCLLC